MNMQAQMLAVKQEWVELLIYSAMVFFIPLLLKYPQILVGTVVNTALIISALNLRAKKIIPIIVLPSIAVALGGYLFGGFTYALVYLIPFIWVGNLILVLAMKYLNLFKKINYVVSLTVSSALKSFFLFISALILFYLGVIPAPFLVAMGLIQFVTAFSGGIIAFAMQEIKTGIF